jgi:TolB-like protein/DNA-binding winged helix-turn-helix (wHTH) protein
LSEAPVQTDFLELDLRRYELRRGSSVLKLEKIPMELLILLVERRDQLVGREEIIARLWRKDVFLDTEQGINTAIRKIRLTLGDDPNDPRFLQTIVGKGYRFVGPITVVNATPAAAAARAPVPATDEETQPSRPKTALRWKLVAFAAVFLLAGAVVVAFRYFDWIRWFPRRSVHSIAVLPLKNLSGNPADEYFADGMTDELITNLAKISALRVTSYTSVSKYKTTSKPLPQVAQELQVDGIVEGSVLRSGDQVRITAQLIYASRDQHLWAEEYQRYVRDVLYLNVKLRTTLLNRFESLSRLTNKSVWPRRMWWIPRLMRATFAGARFGTSAAKPACSKQSTNSTKQLRWTQGTHPPTRAWPTAIRRSAI